MEVLCILIQHDEDNTTEENDTKDNDTEEKSTEIYSNYLLKEIHRDNFTTSTFIYIQNVCCIKNVMNIIT